MNQGRTVFSQLISFLPDREFRRCVERYQGDLRLRGFSCWAQYLAMAFAQLTYRESLRDIEACLGSLQGKLYHLGFRGKVARSTLADANESRDWHIFADFAQRLIAIARGLYVREPMGVDLEQSLYALDSTTIDLCLTLFPWARFRRRKAAVKLHTLLDLRGNIPTFIRVTDGKVHDVNMLDEITPEAASFFPTGVFVVLCLIGDSRRLLGLQSRVINLRQRFERASGALPGQPSLCEATISMRSFVLLFLLCAAILSSAQTPPANADVPRQIPSFDITAIDKTVDPCVDFYQLRLRQLDEEQSGPTRQVALGTLRRARPSKISTSCATSWSRPRRPASTARPKRR